MWSVMVTISCKPMPGKMCTVLLGGMFYRGQINLSVLSFQLQLVFCCFVASFSPIDLSLKFIYSLEYI